MSKLKRYNSTKRAMFMKYEKFSQKLNVLAEPELLLFYLDAVKNNPKPEHMSQSLYLTCMALNILEQSGNAVPSQKEIDYVEQYLNRYSKRKSTKIYFNNTPEIMSTYKIMHRAV